MRIKEKMGVHPKIISFMLPFFINVHLISTLVYDGAVCFSINSSPVYDVGACGDFVLYVSEIGKGEDLWPDRRHSYREIHLSFADQIKSPCGFDHRLRLN